nr:MAG TPA: hypothetical protein [Caudoviricetes sp.]
MNKRFNLQDFLDQKLAVYCSTKEDSLDFLQYLEDNTSIEWSGGGKPTDFFLEKVCYSLDDSQGDLVWASLEEEDLTGVTWKKESEDVNMKYKVGDKVRIRKDLQEGDFYKGFYVNEKMKSHKGEIRIIRRVIEEAYKLEEDENDWNWTEEMLEPINEDEVETVEESKKQEEQEERIVSFEDIEDQKDGFGLLDDDNEEEFIQTIKNNVRGLLTFYDCDITYKDIPSVISWLQDIYTYGQQQLKKQVEYVDFQTALAWMKENEDNEAKFGNDIFCYTYGNLWVKDVEENYHITTLTLPMVESKEWIIIKED